MSVHDNESLDKYKGKSKQECQGLKENEFDLGKQIKSKKVERENRNLGTK